MDKILDVFELYADSNENKINDFNRRLSSTMDVKIEAEKPKIEGLWMDKVEKTIPYIENILAAPTRLIVNEEEVVKIEKIKKVTVESIKHLSKNAGFIEDVDENGDVKPGKLLNVFKEETLNTYENRFIYTLIQKMRAIVVREKNKLLKEKLATSKEFKQVDYQGKSYNGKDKVDIQIIMTSSSESSKRTKEIKEMINRLKTLEKTIGNLMLTTTYQTLEKQNVQLITPPLKKNNVILKNVNFQYAAKLWDFLINEMDKMKVTDMENKEKKYKERGKAKKLVDETFLLDYLILQSVENPEIKNKYKKEIIEQLIANMVERTIDVNEGLTEEQLKNLVSKQYKIIKYKRQASNKEVQEIFKKYISKYVLKISEGEKR
ncbi:MAG TPA: DUF2357 domain-containing protein [Candidatus Scatovivens faecipullorum]|nr:DUF2357 domain-containing protein [Candidatus Scatovivens faecipullorum]